MAAFRAIYIVLCLFILIAFFKGSHGQDHCKLVSSCSCKFDNGQYLDLSPLAGKGGLPRFLNMTDVDRYDSFSWNPCNNFTEGRCKEVAVCQIRPATPGDLFFTVGWQQTAQFAYDNQTGKQLLTYTAATTMANSVVMRSAIITLTCSQNGNTTLKVTGQKTPTSSLFLFELVSPHSCRKGSASTSSSGLSRLEIILISALSGVVLLLVILIPVWLKMTGKICKRVSYETLN